MAFSKADELGKMTPLQWGPLVLPATSIRNTVSTRLETNSYISADADYLRKMGSSSRTFAVELVFDNSTGTFPDTYRKFLKMVHNGKALILKHPVYGDILCFGTNYSDDLNATHRSGVNASITFVETLDVNPTVLTELRSTNVKAFSDIDVLSAAEKPEFEDEPSLFDTLADIAALENKIKGLGSQLVMNINTSINKLNTAVDGAIDIFKAGAAASNMLAVAVLRGKMDAYQMKQPKSLNMYVVPSDMSIAELASKIPTSQENLLSKNPTLKGKLLVKKNMQVFY